MKFTCPYCGKTCDFEEMQMDADLHAIIKMLPTFGAHANLVAAYTELFGISPLKTKRKKWRLLLEEMKRLFDAEGFEYQKRRYRISQAGIADALNIMVHKHWDAHLENHNYLKKIMIGIAEASAKDVGKQEEKDLRKREERLRAGDRSNPPSSPFAKGGKEEAGKPHLGKGDPDSISHFGKGGQGGFYEEQAEQVTPPPMKTIPAAQLTDAQLATNKRRLQDMMKKIGG